MQRIRPDRKTLAVITLIIALGGLLYFQYRMLSAYYILSKDNLDRQLAMTLEDMAQENFDRTLLSNLVAAVIKRDTINFPVGMDSLRKAGTQFFDMYLTDRFARANLPTTYEFAVIDQVTRQKYLSSENYSTGIQWYGNYKLPLAGVITRECQCAPFLNVRFSRLETVLMRGIGPIMWPAIICLFLLILGFYLLLSILREQKYLDRVKNDFINNLTHELKTPVFSISLATRLMREKSDGSTDKYLDQVEYDIEHLKGNVEKVLELASIENSKNLLAVRSLNVSEFLKEWRNERTSGTESERMEWEEEVSADVYVKADQEHLKNALNNLLDNALKYGDAQKPVHISSLTDQESVAFSVKDAGPGIDKKYQEAIFDKFYRVRNGHTGARGYGLGLSYVRQVITMMKGTVSVSSSPNEGSKFEIKLPRSK